MNKSTIKGTFTWAVARMKEGHKVKRTKWSNDVFHIYYKESQDTFCDLNHNETVLGIEEYIAEDWEVVEEVVEKDKDWNLADNDSSGLYFNSDLIECRDLIIEDLIKEGHEEGDYTLSIINKRFGDLK